MRRGSQDRHNHIRNRRRPLDDPDAKFPVRLDKSRPESVYSIAERLLVVYSTVLRHLHDSIGFELFHLHWVPHLLRDDFRKMQKEYARAILPLTQAIERDGGRPLVTGDGFRLFFNTSPRRK
jgi:hypothetical protein